MAGVELRDSTGLRSFSFTTLVSDREAAALFRDTDQIVKKATYKGYNTTYLFLSCSASTSARTDLLARVTLAFLLTLTLPTRPLPASGSFSVLESSKLARLALLL